MDSVTTKKQWQRSLHLKVWSFSYGMELVKFQNPLVTYIHVRKPNLTNMVSIYYD